MKSPQIALLSVLACAAAAWAQEGNANASLAPVANELADLAQKAHLAALVNFERGLDASDQPCAWSLRWMQAASAAAPDQSSRLTAKTDYVERTELFVRMAQTRYQAGQATLMDVYKAKYYALVARQEIAAANQANKHSDEAKEAPTPGELADLAKNASEASASSFDHGTTGSEQTCAWSRRWMQAEWAAAQDDAARQAVRNQYAKRTEAFLKVVQKRVAAGQSSEAELLIAQYYTLQARQELLAGGKVPAGEANVLPAPTPKELAEVAQKAYEAIKADAARGIEVYENACPWSQRWTEAECAAAPDEATRLLMKKVQVIRLELFLRAVQGGHNSAWAEPDILAVRYYLLLARQEFAAAGGKTDEHAGENNF